MKEKSECERKNPDNTNFRDVSHGIPFEFHGDHSAALREYIAMGKSSGKSFDKWILQEVAEKGKKRLVIALSKPSRRRYGGGGCNALTQPTSDDIKVGRTISFHGCNYLPPLSIHTQYTTEMFRTSKSYTTCQFGL